MATSAIGPGFLTQTTLFTERIAANFGFVILISVLLDIGAQMNIWRIVSVAKMRAQEIANVLVPGLGIFLATLIAVGGLIFNIGNIAGCGLGLNVLFGIRPEYGAMISCIIALGIFWFREAGLAMDNFAKVLGILMIGLTLYIAISSGPPVNEALYRTVWPEKIDVVMIVTIVGGTVGGYISFAGAHRLLDAGITGKEMLPQVTRSSVSGILITSIMRFVLFFAALGVVSQGLSLDPKNPAASVFSHAAGQLGYKFFGVVLWAAAITSVVGCSYTTVSFWKTFHRSFEKNNALMISAFIVASTIIFVIVGNPVKVLITAGAVNGIILPIALAVMLVAAQKRKIIGDYRHPGWMHVAGWIVVAAMGSMAVYTISAL